MAAALGHPREPAPAVAPTRSSSSSRTAAALATLFAARSPDQTMPPDVDAVGVGHGHVRQPDRLRLAPAVGAGDPGDRRGHRRREPVARALGHRPRHLGADRAVRREDGARDAEQRLLRLVRVRDDAAGK